MNFKEKKWQKRRTSQVHSLEEAGIGAKDAFWVWKDKASGHDCISPRKLPQNPNKFDGKRIFLSEMISSEFHLNF